LEVMELTADIREKIVWDLRNTAEIMQMMRNNGFLTLLEDGLIKMIAWKTTIEELRRVI
jgi:type II secretory ATPase GspE/PulE/Tfp pilus assembly ATPase PilB-like protein